MPLKAPQHRPMMAEYDLSEVHMDLAVGVTDRFHYLAWQGVDTRDLLIIDLDVTQILELRDALLMWFPQ